MDLILLILVLALVGFFVHVIITKIPMSPMFRLTIEFIVVIVIILYLIRRFGNLIPNLL